MPQVSLPYGDEKLSVQIPDGCLGELITPRRVVPARDSHALIEAALQHPIGAPRLEDLVRAGQKVAIIIDDITRETPTRLMLPPVVNRLLRAGIDRADISIVVALGTHRPMTESEIATKTGAGLADELRIVNDPCWDENRMVFLGTSPGGIPAWVNREVARADVRIALGSITPHMDTGYSGGAKMILPGVCDSRTVEAFHARQVKFYGNQLGVVECPLRLDLERFVTEVVGLDFILNAVLTADGALYRCVAGHCVAAHREGVRFAREVYGIPVRRRYPVVIANAFPSEIDLWQSTKAIASGELLTCDGGMLVLVSPCREGNATHPLVADYIGTKPELLERELEDGSVRDPIACALGIVIGRMRRRIRFGLVSAGLAPADAARMGFTYFNKAEEAFSKELERCKITVPIAILTHAGVTLPLVG